MTKSLSFWIYKVVIFSYVFAPVVGVVIAMALLWNQYVFLSDIILMIGLYMITGIGVTIGYHRLLAHQSFKTYAPIRALYLILGCAAFQGPPITWASTHICHHANSDHEHDPHSPLEGFWHAHFGWILSGQSMKDAHEHASHLYSDPAAVFVQRTALIWTVLSLYIPFLIGGWTGFVWGGLVRMFLLNHVTWSVNSICHIYGNRMFDTPDESKNHWIVGLLAAGEGWHNNHHAFPSNAYHGMRWWQFDLSGYIIRSMKFLGLAWDIKSVTPEAEAAYHERSSRNKSSLSALVEQLRAAIAEAKAELSKLPDPGSEVKTLALKRLASINKFANRKSVMQEKVARQYLQEIKDLVQRARGAVL